MPTKHIRLHYNSLINCIGRALRSLHPGSGTVIVSLQQHKSSSKPHINPTPPHNSETDASVQNDLIWAKEMNARPINGRINCPRCTWARGWLRSHLGPLLPTQEIGCLPPTQGRSGRTAGDRPLLRHQPTSAASGSTADKIDRRRLPAHRSSSAGCQGANEEANCR